METPSLVIRKSCNDCKHHHMNFEEGVPECRRYPPEMKVFLVPGPVSPVTRQPQGHGFLKFSAYPQINPAFPCGEHTQRPALQEENVNDQKEGNGRLDESGGYVQPGDLAAVGRD